ncbi:phage tail tube protein [Actinomadura harenae]|uniref:Phage tail protein n=1 Tax=Actinomadura harenae TaxID=2483351 RepID=A0A3M2MDG3_9ACTN|nr:phage tail tube protein [Actinomadura harenae]RMI47607.1 hypothetical protein EBO15_01515 [Actinomadura harenae]
MAAPTIYPGARSFFGLAKEVTPGTPVAAARFVPWKKLDPVDQPVILVDDGMRGSMGSDYGATVGPTKGSGDVEGPVFADSIGDLLYNILGDYGVSGTGPFIHTFSLLNSGNAQPPTHTITDANGMTPTVGARCYPGACFSELTLTGNVEALFTHSGKYESWISQAAAVAPTNTPTSEVVVPSWRSTVTIGGSSVITPKEWEVTIKRTLTTHYTAQGSQNPYVIARGDLSVDGKISFVAADESPLNALLANTQQALVLTVDNGLTGANQRTVTLQMTKAYYKTSKLKRDPAAIGWDVEFTALMNATDAGTSGGLAPIKATLKNGITTY